MKMNILGQQIADDAPSFLDKLRTVTPHEFGLRIAKAFDESRSSTTVFFIQNAFIDCEDSSVGLFWDEYQELLDRFAAIEKEEKQGEK